MTRDEHSAFSDQLQKLQRKLVESGAGLFVGEVSHVFDEAYLAVRQPALHFVQHPKRVDRMSPAGVKYPKMAFEKVPLVK
jgi:hypothetical protein